MLYANVTYINMNYIIFSNIQTTLYSSNFFLTKRTATIQKVDFIVSTLKYIYLENRHEFNIHTTFKFHVPNIFI